MKMIKNLKLLLLFVAIITFFSGCAKNADDSIEEININGTMVSFDASELNLRGSDITDISAIFQLKDLKKLDLRDTDVLYSDIQSLQSQLPGCDVLFDVKIGGGKYQNSVASLDLSDENIEDIDDLIYKISLFTQLTEVQLSSRNIALKDYRALQSEYSDIDFPINIYIEGDCFSQSDYGIDLSQINTIDIEKLIYSLRYFEDIKQVDFGSISLKQDEMSKLVDAHPYTEFLWNVELLGEIITPDMAEMDISDTTIEDFNGFNNALRLLPNITYLEMCNCGLNNENMETLQKNYPEKKFVWTIRVGNWEMRTDVKAFSTGTMYTFEGGKYLGYGRVIYDEDVAPLKYCTDLIALDLGHQVYLNDFTFLESMTNLQYLIIAITGIEDLTPLMGLGDLIYLEMFNTDVEDLSPLLELPNLKHLNCSLTLFQGTDILLQMTQLERLWVISTSLTDEEIEKLHNGLPNTTIAHGANAPTYGWRTKDAQVYIDMQELFNLPTLFSD